MAVSFVHNKETSVITDTTNYSGLTPSGRSSYNVLLYVFSYTSATERTQLTDVTPNDTDANLVTTWTLSTTEDLWVRTFMLRSQRSASPPGSPTDGDTYFDTDDSNYYYYDSGTTTWIQFDPTVFDDTNIVYEAANSLRDVAAATCIFDVGLEISVKRMSGDDCDICKFSRQYTEFRAILATARVVFADGNHVTGFERINYINTNCPVCG